MSARRIGIAIAALAAAVLLAWRCTHESRSTSTPASVAAGGSAATRAPAAPALTAPGSRAATARNRATAPARPFDATLRHTADPCTAPIEPAIPSGYETATADGITIAWTAAELTGPLDAPLKPVALAHLAAGMLEEIAQLTGTERRAELTIIVDASRQDFLARTKAPQWVGGLYDGGAVIIYAKASEDLGVALATLRHELVHAQLHVAIGCMPFWLDEGLAQYIAGPPPLREWVAMLRTREPFDLATLDEPAVFDLAADNVQRMYAVSLALIVEVTERAGEGALRELVHDPRHEASYRAVLDALAKKLFELPAGGDLDGVLRGAVCCTGMRSPAAVACRGAAARDGETSWVDTTSVPRAACRNRW